MIILLISIPWPIFLNQNINVPVLIRPISRPVRLLWRASPPENKMPGKSLEALSNDAGKFVAATAGPNFESLIAAMGSGAATRSKENNKYDIIMRCRRRYLQYRYIQKRGDPGDQLYFCRGAVAGRSLLKAESGGSTSPRPQRWWIIFGLKCQIGDSISKADIDKNRRKVCCNTNWGH